MARRQRAALLACALTIGTAAYVAPIGGSASAAATTTRTVTKVQGGYVTTIKYPNGDVTKVFAAAPVTVTVANSVASVRRTVGGRTRTVHSATETVSVPASVASTVSRPGVTAEQELRALGSSAKDAAAFRSMNAGPTPITAAAKAAYTKMNATSVSTRTVAATASASGYPIVGSLPLCIDKYLDGHHLHIRGCDTEYRIGTHGRIWYLENTHQFIGTMRDGCTWSCWSPDEVTGLKFSVHYPRGAALYNVDPDSTHPMGSCRTTEVGVDYKGIGIKSTQTECPETWGLYTYTGHTFATKWDGQGSGPHWGSRATHGVDAAYSTTSSSRSRSISYTTWWE